MKTLLGAAIKAERSALGISQEELAYRAGLHRTYVSDVERGARNLSLESVEKLARALDISMSLLFDRAIDGNDQQLVDILLVEDNPHDVELTKRAFAKARITNLLHLASDGEEALDFLFGRGRYAHRAQVQHPQIVLLDLNLPKKSGIEVLRAIKADERTRAVPVIVLTASRKDSDIRECRRLGAETYLVKPVGFENFSQVTRQFQLGWALVSPTTQ